MGKPEQQRTDKAEEKPESEQPNETTDDAFTRHVRRFLQVLPNLRNIRVRIPIGTTLEIEDWIFPVVEFCDGVVVEIGGEDKRWIPILGAGMPDHLPRVDIFFSASYYSEKYKDFAFQAKGVLANPADPEKGKGYWRCWYPDPETGEEFIIHLWYMCLYMRGLETHLLAHYNSGTNELYTKLTRMPEGVRFEAIDIRLDKLKLVHKLIDHHFLLSSSQAILDAAAERRGRKSLADVDRDTLPAWSACYNETLSILQAEMNRRGSKQYKKYKELEARFDIIQRAIKGIDPRVAESLGSYTSLSDVALQYTAHSCSNVPIGTWGHTVLFGHLKESDKLNGVKRNSREKAIRK